jgi:hypothetical protein
MPPADIDGLPPTQYLVIDVLAARARLGEPYWTFPSRMRPTMRALADRGLLWWQRGPAPLTIQAFLTPEGRTAVLYDGYRIPVAAKLRELAALWVLEVARADTLAGQRPAPAALMLSVRAQAHQDCITALLKVVDDLFGEEVPSG